ncbi:MAG: alcohol dehydrogenase catalytic domain-containing protein [Nanoarchaeota archaeon]|nr:alcohol dehydrogenase catalytic domain-containing protein [Nanoarchaeota archaeon]
MKVAVYHNNNDIRIEHREVPKINDNELLVRIKASGICGTDLMEWYRIQKGPRVLGHEISGDIVKAGKNVKNFKIGQRVFATHHVPCNECKYCSEGNHTACEALHNGNFEPGGFSEYVRVPEQNVKFGTFLLPDNVSYEEATFIEPLACVVRGQRIVNLKKNHNVLILGSGVSGLLNIQLAKLNGAKATATDISDYRLKKAIEFGADRVFHSDEFDNEINEYKKNFSKENFFLNKFDRIIICTGAMPAFQQAFKSVDRKGTILFFAIPNKNIEMPTLDFWRNEITYTSSYGAAPNDLKESLKLILDGKINVKDMVTHKLPLDKIQEGFRIMADGKESLKVLIEP